MSEIILRDIDAVLLGRVNRVAEAHGWSLQAALLNILEQGLFVCEGELSRSFDESDSRALQDAIAAMESVPSDQGFARIGRAGDGDAAPVAPPDQSIRQDLFPNTAPLPSKDEGDA
ncbi:hypothetical protein H4F99_10355 [Lysobacter sp. SG-8]|uniref:Uncharacterized protein n=1 Tax=Marilutibacter penaei TaxID=2759900 RepID=A0A7W3YF74_9GAMM|nr:hypothetical protein [Lysobacter penaei]MBB1088892.1 hypothetical protein [Lysobacter penaei]